MLDLDQLQILGQLADNMELTIRKLETSFEKKNGEEFSKARNEILEIQKKIGGIISQK